MHAGAHSTHAICRCCFACWRHAEGNGGLLPAAYKASYSIHHNTAKCSALLPAPAHASKPTSHTKPRQSLHTFQILI